LVAANADLVSVFFSMSHANATAGGAMQEFVATGFVPQWDFLDFLADKATTLPSFRLMRSAEMTDLVVENGRVTGILATSVDGDIEILADFVVAADGRHSTSRTAAGMRTIAKSAPLDVLWFPLPRRPDVATTNLVGPILAIGPPSERDSRRVQRRRCATLSAVSSVLVYVPNM
jgi:2-polyprenyl-6-methoxyphenol hydroxylase-like FAD-dependent oxidoreductase